MLNNEFIGHAGKNFPAPLLRRKPFWRNLTIKPFHHIMIWENEKIA